MNKLRTFIPIGDCNVSGRKLLNIGKNSSMINCNLCISSPQTASYIGTLIQIKKLNYITTEWETLIYCEVSENITFLGRSP